MNAKKIMGTALSLEFLNPREGDHFPLLVHTDDGHGVRRSALITESSNSWEDGVLVRIFEPREGDPCSILVHVDDGHGVQRSTLMMATEYCFFFLHLIQDQTAK